MTKHRDDCRIVDNNRSLVRIISDGVFQLEHNSGTDLSDNYLSLFESIERNLLPTGSGFDNGTTIDVEKSSINKIVFNTSFHHMNEHGYYTRWSEHKVTVTPAFNGLNIKVSGRDINDIKEYIADSFLYTLDERYQYCWDIDKKEHFLLSK